MFSIAIYRQMTPHISTYKASTRNPLLQSSASRHREERSVGVFSHESLLACRLEIRQLSKPTLLITPNEGPDRLNFRLALGDVSGPGCCSGLAAASKVWVLTRMRKDILG